MILKKIILYVYANSATRLRCFTSLDSRCVLDVYPGGANINALTSERLTDIGGGATFYSTLVEVAKA